ncbi:MAG: Fic family protein [Pseudomonadota bacterium]
MTYAVITDPYCYAGTSVLKNIPGIHDQATLDAFEAVSTAQRSDEPLPGGRLSVTHYKSVHSHLFQDIYAWAGRFRTIRIGKSGNMFCYPENIAREMKQLFSELKLNRHLRDLSRDDFAGGAARFLATLNAIHPFREGNGRTQTVFLALLADHAGHPLEMERLVPANFLAAMIASFGGDEEPLAAELRKLI